MITIIIIIVITCRFPAQVEVDPKVMAAAAVATNISLLQYMSQWGAIATVNGYPVTTNKEHFSSTPQKQK